ncbi:hypothetical protein NE237_026641 [Protea cynaroides]|uniref:Uncharacterized protein n=1 Tax=Protea cynaroides TaxID=273540 RepID=A0A9Q0H7H5_9MAGN|nr:hypothetical protein NE237_026641 [Protea cynaroides]
MPYIGNTFWVSLLLWLAQFLRISQLLGWIGKTNALIYSTSVVPEAPVVELQPQDAGADVSVDAERGVVNNVEGLQDPQNKGGEETIEPSDQLNVGSTSGTQAPIQLEDIVIIGRPSRPRDMDSNSTPRAVLRLGSLRRREKNPLGEDPGLQ